MSIATVLIQQLTKEKPVSTKLSLIQELSDGKNTDAPLCNMGVLFSGSEKDEYLKDIEESANEKLRDRRCTVEALFWLYYLATTLNFELPATTPRQKMAKDFLMQYWEDPSQGIEGLISTIKLN